MPRYFKMPSPRLVEGIIQPIDVQRAISSARVRLIAPHTVPPACLQINAGFTSLILKGDRQLERLQGIHRALLRISEGNFQGIAAFRTYVGQHASDLDQAWSMTSDNPQRDDPVVIALRDAALSLPQLRLMMDAPADDASAEEMICFLARAAAHSFQAGIRRHEHEREQQSRHRSAIFGQALICVFVELTGRQPRMSRGAETSRYIGQPAGPLVRFLTSVYAAIRSNAPADMVKSLPGEMLDPSLETLAGWIKDARIEAGTSRRRA